MLIAQGTQSTFEVSERGKRKIANLIFLRVGIPSRSESDMLSELYRQDSSLLLV
jgi:hypothetical protein